MNCVTKIVAVALMAFAATAQAQEGRKEFTMDTGKGGIEIKLSLPGFANGPTDFSGNPGFSNPDVRADGVTVKAREVAFGAALGQSGYVDYRVSITKTDSKTDKLNAIRLAKKMLEKTGQKLEDAHELKTGIKILKSDSDSYTYALCSQPVFDKPQPERLCSIIGTSVTNDGKQTIAVMVSVGEKDVDAYNANPEKFEKRANKAFSDMISNSTVRLLP